ncbi:hypothetical protein [Azospirillum sp.]|uniref:hypothetical protein n=1 Tax=Azospirillum sp. TaxID=34012 RepID=UPI002D3C46A8|nr:hypothetical protein [Azospirillum sp.]HYD64279.1 hypothetical protein [Azospirillum sp.]
MHRPLGHLLPVLGLLSLAACAGGPEAQSLDAISPAALLGHVVLSADGTRELGEVEDVVVGPDGRTAQVRVVSSTPMYYPMERRADIDAGQFRFSRQRNGLLLTGMGPQQFASLPNAIFSEENVLALGPSAVPTLVAPSAGLPGAPTNWWGVHAR